ncbi:hypothetical protein GKZ68_02390 [Hymenobacter sp. BRD128]|uniref:hypothetical protein n=1 Tax=Hymenobacter sp. BRD128 TaxID=2675878 RepID=UPI001563A9FC|nr:hypothetical protein [Hymenobacter sp. BRD128]QKG55585.1 hypothetical protein GKZ68_02390 [Hymenobacter sp. BRD128]
MPAFSDARAEYVIAPRMACAAERLARVLDCLDPAFVNALAFRPPDVYVTLP